MTTGCPPLTPGAVTGLAIVVNPGQREVKVHHELGANRWSDTTDGQTSVTGKKEESLEEITQSIGILLMS